MSQPKVTIIVPVYNVENYLPRCIESILNQTYGNLEILIIDDGSTDNSGKICDQYARQDTRINVIHKQNGGLSDARNVGIDNASSEYVFLLDSDDWIDPKAIEVLHNIAEKEKADIVECGFREIKSDRILNSDACTGRVAKISTSKAVQECITWGQIKPVAWNKLYKRSVIGAVRYPIGRYHEDEFTTYKILYNAKNIFYVDLAFYNYDRSRSDSITSKFKIQNLDGCEAMRQKIHFINEHDDLSIIRKDACNTYCFTFFDSLSKCSKNKMLDMTETQETIRLFLSEKKTLFKSNIEPLYKKCIDLLENEKLEACIKKWNERPGQK